VGLGPLFVFGGVVDRLSRVREIAVRIAASHGVEVFDIQHRREAHGWVLRVVIDRRWSGEIDAAPEAPEQSIGVAECQRFSEDIGAQLDVEDAFDHSYTLEVSSPGLDRPLRNLDDYRRFRGRLAKIVVGEPIENQTFFEGRIEGVDGEKVIVSIGTKGRLCRIPVGAVRRARLEIEF